MTQTANRIRRRWLRGPLGGVAGLMIVLGGTTGCSVNPATGDRQLMFISQEQEIQIGRENDVQIVAQMGLAPDSALQRYVRGIGHSLAAESEMPDLPWTFRVLDDPAINAFALPGGFIYVTRGILAHMESEAQLAGVLGHEIGHVTARHSANQMSRQQALGLGFGLGAVFSETVRDYSDVIGTGLGLLTLRFGRDDERQADDLGVRYMLRENYDPRELAEVMQMLARSSELAERGRLPGWLATHPDPENREVDILAQARELGLPAVLIVRGPEFVRRLDGILFGMDPREGFVEGGVFHHPELAFRFPVPSGWQLQNMKQAVVMATEDGQIAFTLDPQAPEAAMSAFIAQDGLTVTGRDVGQVNGFPAATAEFTAATQNGELRGRVTWIAYDGRTFRFLGLSTPDAWSRNRAIVAQVAGGFQRETDPDVLNVRPDRIDVVDLPREIPFQTFLERYPSGDVTAPRLALMNQVEVDGRIGPGLAKRVTR